MFVFQGGKNTSYLPKCVLPNAESLKLKALRSNARGKTDGASLEYALRY